jgi:hypothetical protein
LPQGMCCIVDIVRYLREKVRLIVRGAIFKRHFFFDKEISIDRNNQSHKLNSTQRNLKTLRNSCNLYKKVSRLPD